MNYLWYIVCAISIIISVCVCIFVVLAHLSQRHIGEHIGYMFYGPSSSVRPSTFSNYLFSEKKLDLSRVLYVAFMGLENESLL